MKKMNGRKKSESTWNIEEVKRQLLQDEDFLQQLKDNVCVENVVDEDKGLDFDEEMLMTGLAMFENDF